MKFAVKIIMGFLSTFWNQILVIFCNNLELER